MKLIDGQVFKSVNMDVSFTTVQSNSRSKSNFRMSTNISQFRDKFKGKDIYEKSMTDFSIGQNEDEIYQSNEIESSKISSHKNPTKVSFTIVNNIFE